MILRQAKVRTYFQLRATFLHFFQQNSHERILKMENNTTQEKKRIYSFDELPIVINVPELAAVLGISKTAAYALSHIKGFPVIHLGKRIVIPRDRLKEWLENHVGSDSDWGLNPYYSNQAEK